MHRSILLLFILAWLGCGKTDAPVSNGNDLTTGYTLSDLPGTDMQVAVKKDQSGNLLERGYFRNGQKEGVWLIYQTGEEAGRVGTLVSYLDGKRNGIYMEFDRRGQIEVEATYQNNQLEGRYARYKFGRIQEESQYHLGKLDGVYKKFYENSAKLQTESEYRNGVQHGYYRFFGEDGNLMLEYEYREGEKVRGGMVEQSGD